MKEQNSPQHNPLPHRVPLSYPSEGVMLPTVGNPTGPTHYGLSLADPAYYSELRKRAEGNRNRPTEAEKLLWIFLSGKKLDGFKFRHQHIISQFIVDFVCLSKKLIIEIDGGYHSTPDQLFNDAMRTARLESLGYKIIRFSNAQVLNHINSVLSVIKTNLTGP